jgi:hypothetical protein
VLRWKHFEIINGSYLGFWFTGLSRTEYGNSHDITYVTLLTARSQIAAVFEFAGAVGLGGEVTKTIAGSIARPEAFRDEPGARV